MSGSEAEDAGGLSPVKDDNKAAAHFNRRTLPFFQLRRLYTGPRQPSGKRGGAAFLLNQKTGGPAMNIAQRYVDGLKRAYYKNGGEKQWADFEKLLHRASKEDMEKLLVVYPNIPDSLLQLLFLCKNAGIIPFNLGRFARRQRRQPQNMAILLPTFRFGSNILEEYE